MEPNHIHLCPLGDNNQQAWDLLRLELLRNVSGLLCSMLPPAGNKAASFCWFDGMTST